MGGEADDARVLGGGSRWGIKGSSEVSEGLTAVYKFETRLDEDAAQTGNKIYAGLSGGFGSLTVGRFNNAAYLSGGIRDIGNAFGSHDLSGNGTGNTVSYGYSTETFTLQADAIMDQGTDTDKAVDQVQFGLAVNIGDIGKVALGYEKAEDAMTDIDMGVSVHAHKDNPLSISDTGTVTNLGNVVGRYKGGVVDLKDVELMDGSMIVKVVSASALSTDTNLVEKDGVYYENSSGCINEAKEVQSGCTSSSKVEAYHLVTVVTSNPDVPGDPEADAKKTYTAKIGADAAALSTLLEGALEATGIGTTYGHKASHISASFGLGAMTARLGYSSKDSNNPMHKMKMKTTFVGATGSIGDTGMDWRAFGRKVEDYAGKETSPWGIGVGKALGGGAYTYIEHQNDDDGNSGSTQIGLHVDF